MSTKEPIVDLDAIDLDQVVADLETIRRYNPQRFEMEQLTAVAFEDTERKLCVGYKDITEDEFWVRGHMPGVPLMPGVLICEAAAQLSSYFVHRYGLMGESVVGFGGLEGVRFRDPVRPGSRLVIVCAAVRLRPRAMIVCDFQAYVERTLVCEGTIKGIPLPASLWTRAADATS